MKYDADSERADAQIREAEAQLELLKAHAEETAAIAEMERISGLLATLKRERERYESVRSEGLAERLADSRRAIEIARDNLAKAIDRASTHYTEWDHAGQNLIRAKLKKAGAKIRLNKSSL